MKSLLDAVKAESTSIFNYDAKWNCKAVYQAQLSCTDIH